MGENTIVEPQISIKDRISPGAYWMKRRKEENREKEMLEITRLSDEADDLDEEDNDK